VEVQADWEIAGPADIRNWAVDSTVELAFDILAMLKASENPPMLPPSVESVRDLAGCWWIAHTKARFEKALARDLLRCAAGYYLPLMERVNISRGRKSKSLKPLFPSYVFVCGTEDDRSAALKTNRICRMIEVPDQTALIDELANIEKAIAGSVQLDPYPFAVKGRRCRVSAGPLQGLEGIVVRRAGTSVLVLQVNMIAQAATLQIDADLLSPVD
jgi:transcription antitermination factor NusG